MRYVVVLGAVGCTFIAGPPDFSNVVSPLAEGEIALRSSGIEVRLVPAAGFTEGLLTLRVDGVETTYVVPGEVPGWNPGEVSVLHADVDIPCDGAVVAAELLVSKPNGYVLDTLSRSFVVEGAGLVLGAEQIPLGAVELPLVVCGDLPNQEDEFDEVRLNLPEGGSIRAELLWDGTQTDLDLVLTDDDGNQLISDEAAGPLQPAVTLWTLAPGLSYRVQPTWFEGPDVQWKLVVSADIP